MEEERLVLFKSTYKKAMVTQCELLSDLQLKVRGVLYGWD
jgi:hypothetical protein